MSVRIRERFLYLLMARQKRCPSHSHSLWHTQTHISCYRSSVGSITFNKLKWHTSTCIRFYFINWQKWLGESNKWEDAQWRYTLALYFSSRDTTVKRSSLPGLVTTYITTCIKMGKRTQSNCFREIRKMITVPHCPKIKWWCTTEGIQPMTSQ